MSLDEYADRLSAAFRKSRRQRPRQAVDPERKRAWMMVDFAIRHSAPVWLELAGMKEQADTLRALPEFVNASSYEKHGLTVRKIRDEARSRRLAADAADSAADAAAAAADAYAYARHLPKRTRPALQQSALALLDRMIALSCRHIPGAGERRKTRCRRTIGSSRKPVVRS